MPRKGIFISIQEYEIEPMDELSRLMNYPTRSHMIRDLVAIARYLYENYRADPFTLSSLLNERLESEKI